MSELPPDPTAAAPRRWPWMRIAFFASLGLNLVVIGLVAGLAIKGPPGPPPGGPGMEPGLRGYGDAMPEPFRRDLGKALRASRDDWSAPRDRIRQMRADLAAALTAEPYDPAAAARVLDEGTGLMTELSRRGSALVLEQIARMDAAERAEYARRLQSPPRGRGPGGHGPGGHGPSGDGPGGDG